MKRKTTVLVGVAGLTLLSGLLIAATEVPSTAPAAPAAASSTPPGPGEAWRAQIHEQLGLTAEQQKQMDALRAKQRTELEALKAATDVTPEARHEKARAIVASYREQMKAILTPEQQKKAEAMRERFAERGPGFGPGRGQNRGQGFGPGQHPAGPQAGGFGSHAGGPKMGERPQQPLQPLALLAEGDRVKDRIAEKLGLTEEQRDQLAKLGRAHRAQQRELAKKHMEELRAVLTPEQQKKIDEFKQHQRPQRGPAGCPPALGEAGEELSPPGMREDRPGAPVFAGPDFGPGAGDDLPDDLPPDIN